MKKNMILTDAGSMELKQHGTPAFPAELDYDELDRFDKRCIQWHWHPEIELVYVENGPIECRVENETMLLEAGEGLLINANRMHMMRAPPGVAGTTLPNIVASPEFIAPRDSLIYEKYLRPFVENRAIPFIRLGRGQPWQQAALQAFYRAFEGWRAQAPGNELAVHQALCGLWLGLLQHEDAIQTQALSGAVWHAQERIKRMMAHVQKNYRQRVRLGDIAGAANISKSECIRCFAACLGTTPIKYLTEYRIEMACNLLLSTSKSVKEIAAACGFEDTSYFNKLFKRSLGLTPLGYRRGKVGEEGTAEVQANEVQ